MMIDDCQKSSFYKIYKNGLVRINVRTNLKGVEEK